MGRIVACANQKGGVGKTTTVVSLAAFLALDGRRVLVIDADPQGNATSGLGIDRDGRRLSLYDVLIDDADLASVRLSSVIAGLDVVPSTIAMAATEVELAAVDGRERRLARKLAQVAREYDHVLIDCPPSLGLLTVGALAAADEVLVPVQCEYYALEGLSQLMATINLVRDHLNPALEINGVVLTMFDPRTRLSGQVRDEVRRHMGKSVYRTVIPRSVRLAEAPSHGLPVSLYRPQSKGAQAYRQLAREFRRRARSWGQGDDRLGVPTSHGVETGPERPLVAIPVVDASRGEPPSLEDSTPAVPAAATIDGSSRPDAPGWSPMLASGALP